MKHNFFYHTGRYCILITEAFKRPDRDRVFWSHLFREFKNLGVDSIGIVAIISIFMGAVVAMQTAYNIDSPLIPMTMVGFTTRQSVILEFSPTIVSLILAGKVGSRIASEIGSMRVSEQIDALKIMGVNPPNFLILPKITAAMIINPALIIISIGIALFGGWVVAALTNLVTPQDYIEGLRFWFDGYTVFYAMVKTVVFAFIITSVSGYMGYYVEGGSLEVGTNSTKAVVYSSILIIVFNLILTQILLT